MQNLFPRCITLCILYFLFVSTSFANQQLIIEPDNGRAPLLNAIKTAKFSVDLVMYGLTDLQFVNALIAANENHKNVKVLLQHFPYKAEDENKIAIADLQSAHIPLQWPDARFKLLHQKTLLIDDDKAIIMTFNLTHSSFTKERNFALLVTDPSIVREIKTVFDADWRQSNVKIQDPNLIWSPDNSREKLLALIQKAKTEIKIYAEGLNDYQIVGALAKASRSGIKITLLTSSFDNKPASKQFNYLARNGVKILYSQEYVIHAKVLIIDDTEAVLGSINLTKQSINNNRELAVLTQDPIIINQLNRTFSNDCGAATTVISTPTRKTDTTEALLKSVKKLAVVAKQYHFYPFKKTRHTHKHHAHHRANDRLDFYSS